MICANTDEVWHNRFSGAVSSETDAAIVTTYMMLKAWDMGLGSCWMVAPVLGESGMRKVLNLNDDEKIVSILAIGKPAIDATDKRSPKKSLDEIMEIIE